MSGLIEGSVRKAGERRGFAVMRLLTHWTDIVGTDLAKMARPVNVGYSRDGFGATLTVLSNGSNAPLVQQMLPQIQERVNACYGYNAISRVRITQTAPEGFGEAQESFEQKAPKDVPAEIKEASAEAAQGIESKKLRQAIERLGQNVMAKQAK